MALAWFAFFWLLPFVLGGLVVWRFRPLLTVFAPFLAPRIRLRLGGADARTFDDKYERFDQTYAAAMSLARAEDRRTPMYRLGDSGLLDSELADRPEWGPTEVTVGVARGAPGFNALPKTKVGRHFSGWHAMPLNVDLAQGSPLVIIGDNVDSTASVLANIALQLGYRASSDDFAIRLIDPSDHLAPFPIDRLPQCEAVARSGADAQRQIALLERLVDARLDELDHPDRAARKSRVSDARTVIALIQTPMTLHQRPDFELLRRLGRLLSRSRACKVHLVLGVTCDEPDLPEVPRLVGPATYAPLKYWMDDAIGEFGYPTGAVFPDEPFPREVADQLVERARRSMPQGIQQSASARTFTISDLFDVIRLSELQPIWTRPDDGLALPAGFDEHGERFVIRFTEEDAESGSPSIFVAGVPGSGKTTLLRTMMASLALSYSPADAALLVFDMKGGPDYAWTRDLPHTLIHSTDPVEAHRWLEAMRDEFDRRMRRFAAVGLRSASIVSYRRAGHIDMPSLLFFIDEAQPLMSHGHVGRSTGSLLHDLSRRGRSAGIHFVVSAIRPGDSVLDKIRETITDSLVLRLSDRLDSISLLGDDAATRLRGKGDGLFQKGSTRTETRREFQAALLDPERDWDEWAQLVKRIQGEAQAVGAPPFVLPVPVDIGTSVEIGGAAVNPGLQGAYARVIEQRTKAN